MRTNEGKFSEIISPHEYPPSIIGVSSAPPDEVTVEVVVMAGGGGGVRHPRSIESFSHIP